MLYGFLFVAINEKRSEVFSSIALFLVALLMKKEVKFSQNIFKKIIF